MTDRMEFMVEDAELIFMNFRGRESAFNDEGNRNFAIVLEEDQAAQLAADGWLVKRGKPREGEEEDSSRPYIKVAVGYKHVPPSVIMITSNARTHLDQDTIGTLDFADLQTVDLICNGYEWEVGGKTGVKAYLKTMFVTINENPLEIKYGMPALVEEHHDD